VPGLYRGNLGIIFARPETGKTTFCAFTAAQYIKQGKKVVYWANEEPAKKIKLRIIQSCLQKDKEEMRRDIESDRQVWQTLIKPHLTIMDSVGTSIEELDEYCSVNKPDVVFATS
jgi:Replicative DNA helicase